MAAEKLPMRKLREIVRLKLHCKSSQREIARACDIAPSTVSDYAARIAVAGLSWPLPPELEDDAALERLLFPHEGKPSNRRPEPDWARVHAELKRKHVTLMLLWQEYRQQHPDGVQYSQFCDHYATWRSHGPVTMRQEHRAGEKAFVDFSGDGVDIIDPKTGEVLRAKLFVAVLGGSSLTYVEPVLDESLPTWIGCHVRAFEYFGGVPEIVVPDNLKSGVKSPDRYEPELNPTYADWAQHYGCAVIPARVRRPRDKAKVEAAVLLAERWILAVLRHRKFHSLNDLHEAVVPLVERAERVLDPGTEPAFRLSLRQEKRSQRARQEGSRSGWGAREPRRRKAPPSPPAAAVWSEETGANRWELVAQVQAKTSASELR